jgi:uncharacterized lipoprotein YbaY
MAEDPANSELPNEIEPLETAPKKTNNWLIGVIILFVIILVGILAYADLSSVGIIDPPEPTQPAVFITITEPSDGTLLDTTWAVPVKGEGGGLFEGNVVVQALSASGEVLAQQATIIEAPDAGIGGSGPWAVDLHINAPPGTQGQIVAFSTSPVDGSTVAKDSLNVGYGESTGAGDLVKPENYFWSLESLNGRSLIEGTLITLQFENFQAFGSGGCNRYNTSYERSGTNLNFGIVTSTAMECEEPEGILAQESEYFTALEQVVAYRVENQQLKLFDNSGSLLLVYDTVVMGNIVSEIDTEIPEDALVYVHLSDVSLADAEAMPIAEQVISGANQFPIPYMVKYNPREIIDNHTYAVGVRIEDNSESLLFINPTAYHVITAGNPSQVDVQVEAVR